MIATRAAEYQLSDRFRPGAGPVLLTGLQAIARMLIEHQAREARQGRRSAVFLSGYPGSPLGGLDKLLLGLKELPKSDIHLVPGVNEELAATAVWGSQLPLPGKGWTRDSVLGVWYGKAPGVDRCGDVFRHANMLGVHPQGGALILAGDDPGAKSSTLPSACERTLASLNIPVLYPRDATELIRFGLYGVALSRFSGCWVALKVATDVADGFWTVDGDVSDLEIVVPPMEWEGRPWTFRQRTIALAPHSTAAELELFGVRRAAIQAFVAANSINAIELDTPDAWLGIVAAGKTFNDTCQALRDLGLDEDTLRRAGIRLLRLGMPYPLEPGLLTRFADGLAQVLVVEEKGPFIETQLREVLYDLAHRPAVLGGADASGAPLIPRDGELTAGRLAEPLRRLLAQRVDLPPHIPGFAIESRPSLPPLEVLPVQRTPYYCSGCPHNRSTVLPEGSLAGGGIGCHGMAVISNRPNAGVIGATQMGGEGAQWIGQAPFTDVAHLFQNVGDGTYFHSGQLAVQACIAAGVNITYKILYNSAVAMTGGQDPSGVLPVPAMTRQLQAEGVRRIIVCADEPDRYPAEAGWAPGVDLWPRERLDEAQRILRETPGVTVLIYDQRCAAESRRLRKRGKLPARNMRAVINEAVCEGCGDCGAKSNCLSVQPVATAFGRKTRIEQTSCNTDYSCLEGDCPSFVTVEAAPMSAKRREPQVPPAVSEASPVSLNGNAFNVFSAGIGGTGIVTVNQILATAALLDGLQVRGLDQTGLSQKAGPVVSHLRLSAGDAEPANRVGPGQADCYLAFDLLVGADTRNLGYADPERTHAVVSTSRIPTGAMVSNPEAEMPSPMRLLGRIRSRTQDGAMIELDSAAAAEALLGGTETANLLLAGAAYQAGLLPLSAGGIEDAIRINGVAVEANLGAFRWGRVAVADPAAFAAAIQASSPSASVDSTAETWAIGSRLLQGSILQGQTREMVELRAGDLAGFGGERLARSYISTVEKMWKAERELGERTDLSEAVAHGLHKLTAYKDEYEVARLLTAERFRAQLEAQFPGARKMRYRLHPPLLRTLGMRRKIALGPWFTPVLRLLARSRRLRGTPLDVFGYSRIRRTERMLVGHYRKLIDEITARLDAESYDTAVEAAQAADLVRGYEQIKLANVDRYFARLDALGYGHLAPPGVSNRPLELARAEGVE